MGSGSQRSEVDAQVAAVAAAILRDDPGTEPGGRLHRNVRIAAALCRAVAVAIRERRRSDPIAAWRLGRDGDRAVGA